MVDDEVEGVWILKESKVITVWTRGHYWNCRFNEKIPRKKQTKSHMKGWGHRFMAPKEMSIW